jgi:tetratricopeptide (TPR) repeat protein
MSATTAPLSVKPPAQERSHSSWLHRSPATAYLVLILLGGVPYFNTLVNGFVYDDGFQVLKNPYLHSFKYLHQIFFTLAWSFQGTQGLTNYYRPLMTFQYLVLYQLFGPLAYPYHLANVILNVLVVCGLYWVTARLYSNRLFAFLTVALFAVHPIHTEAVAWVASAPDLQMALSILFAFWCFLRLADSEGGLWWAMQGGMGLGFAVGLLSKEPTAMLPILATIFEQFYRDDRRTTRWKTKLSRYSVLWLILGAYLWFRLHFLGAVVPVIQRPRLSWYEVVLTSIALMGQYIGKFFFPLDLSIVYPFLKSSHLSDPRVIGGLVALVVCAALFWFLWKRAPLVSFGLIWFLAMLAPVLNARWMAANVFAERYLYVPSIGLCWILAWAGLRLWEALRERSLLWRTAALGVAGAILVLGTVRTVLRNRDWRDDISLYSSALRIFPQADMVRADLGAALWNRGDHVSSEREWREALRQSPENVIAMEDLAIALHEQKRYDEAISFLNRAVALRPGYAMPHMTLGQVYTDLGEFALAEEELRKAIALNPLFPPGRNHLGELLLQQGRIAEAEEQFLASVNSMPNFQGFDGLGDIYLARGLRDNAERAFREAILDYPYDHHAHFRLAKLCAESGRSAEAIREYKAGLETDPNNAEAQEALRQLKSVGK